MNKKKLYIALAAALAVCGGGALYFVQKNAAAKATQEAKNKEKAAVVPEFVPGDVGKAQQRELANTLEASGSLAAERSATVRSKAAAEVRSITVREGEAVALGQVIATLDGTELQSRLRSAEGVLQSAEARELNAKNTRNMQKSLLDQGFISANAFDSFDATHKAAQGDSMAARAQVALAKQAAQDTVAKAPMAGVVAKRMVNVGEKIGFDAPIVQIVDLRALELQAFAPPEAAAILKIGQSVEVSVAGFAKPFKGSLARVLPAVDASTRQLGLVVRMPAADGVLKAGLDATARLRTEQRTVLTVPVNAVQSANGEPFVWAIQSAAETGTSTIAKQKVVLGTRDEVVNVVEVNSGVAANTRILLGRYEGLKDGQTIALVKTAKPVTPPTAALASASAAPAASAATASASK